MGRQAALKMGLVADGDGAMWRRLSAFFILLILPLIEPQQAIAQQTQPPVPLSPQVYWGPGPWHMWGGGYGWHFWWMPLMMLFMFLLCAAVVYILFVRRPWGGGMHHGGPPWHMMDRMWSPPTHSAMQILNERFARGDIQKDEYEDKKAALLSGGQQ
jgi:putative membrane protein